MFWREVMEAYSQNNNEVLVNWIEIASMINLIYLIDLCFVFVHDGLIKTTQSLFALLEIV